MGQPPSHPEGHFACGDHVEGLQNEWMVLIDCRLDRCLIHEPPALSAIHLKLARLSPAEAVSA